MCKHIKLWTDSVNKVHFRGSMYSKKELAERSFFYNTGSQGAGHVSSGGSSSSRATPSAFLFWRFKAHKWVCAEPSKSQCKNTAFWKGKLKSYLGLARCVFLYQHCFTKVIDTCCRDEIHGKQLSINIIGKEKHTLVTENTPWKQIKKEMKFHLTGNIFHLKHCVYFPILVRIFVETLSRLMNAS